MAAREVAIKLSWALDFTIFLLAPGGFPHASHGVRSATIKPGGGDGTKG